MKLICKPSLPLRVYGPTRSTHKASQGVLITVFAGRCPYFSFRFLFVWQVLQDVVIDRMVVRIPFQYIAALILSSRRVCVQGAGDSGDTNHCTLLEWLGYDQPSFFADTFSVLNKLDFQSFINDCVALIAMFEFCVCFLGFCKLCYCERVYFVILTAIGTHLVQMSISGVALATAFIVRTAPVF
jgi:hypothetical protein